MNKVKVKNIIKRILLILIATVILILGGKEFTEAGTVNIGLGGSVKLDLASLKGTVGSNYSGQVLYCANHSGSLQTGIYHNYKAENYRKIIGTSVYDSNGSLKCTDLINAEFAYVLGGGNYVKGYNSVKDQSSRQRALWHIFNTWTSKAGMGSWKDSNNNSAKQTNDSENLLNQATDYSKKIGTSGEASIKSKVGETIITSNTNAGPFNFKYSGKIKSIIVYDSDGHEIPSSNLSFIVNKRTVNITDIHSEENFYVSNSSNKRLGKLTVTVTPELSNLISAEIWFLDGGASQRLIAAKTKTTQLVPKSASVNIKTYGSLTLKKIDKDTGEELNAGFKIKTSKGWLVGNKGNYSYTFNVNVATVYNSGKIEDLDFDTYSIYEVKAPDGYDITAQNNYDEKNKWVPVKTVNLEPKSDYTNVAVTVSNEKVISISGYVWVDVPETKKNDTNSRYDSYEKKISGIPVRLIDKSTKHVIAETTTDSNGAYKFDGHKYQVIKESTITNYYVEFNYSKTDYRQYIPVAFNSKDANSIVANGSRAIMDNVATRDIDLSGVATTYTGTANETTYGLGSTGNIYKKLYNKSNFTLENINLGIKQLPETEYKIDENLAYVKIKMKGYTYTYNYGGRGDKNLVAAPTVNFQSKGNIRAYTRAIYPSDVSYDLVNSTEELKVNVVYRIDITNTTTYDLPELYQEQKLHVTSLTDKFDSNRYTLNDNNWTSKENVATVKENYLKTIYGKGLGKTETATSFIEFSVKHNAIMDILNHSNDGIIEDFPTEVTSVAHHEYKRNDYSWQNDITKVQTHMTRDDTRSAEAPYLIFKLGQQREIKGNVFEDTVTKESSANHERLGDGKYSRDNENRVGGVKVDLLDAEEGKDITKLQVSKLYGTTGTGKLTAISQPATTTTGSDGSYTLTGIVPGKYYLRYTYGDGTQKIYDTSGNEVNSEINVKNYKSTIVTSDTAKNALKDSKQDGLWYKNMLYKEPEDKDCKNYSVAVDNMDSVVSAQSMINDIDHVKTVKEKQNAGQLTPVMAGTAMISITIENTKADEANVTETSDGTVCSFPGFNFGIIKRPETHLETDKIITNMKLVNAQGNIIFDGNPETEKLAGVSDLDYTENKGSSFARIEMDENQLYGSTLTLTYTIIITNNSDVNYYGEKYYWFGEDKNNQVTVTPITINDYIDRTLTYMSVSEGKTVVQDNTKKIEIKEDEPEVERKFLKVTGFKAIYTTKGGKDLKDCQDSVEITAQRVLSSNDNDMIIYNTEILTDLDSTTGDSKNDNGWKANETSLRDLKVVETNYDKIVKDKVPTEEEEKAGRVIKARDFEALHLVSGSTVTITPPTGNDKISPVLYIATGIISLAILTAGIVIIKKKILK